MHWTFSFAKQSECPLSPVPSNSRLGQVQKFSCLGTQASITSLWAKSAYSFTNTLPQFLYGKYQEFVENDKKILDSRILEGLSLFIITKIP